jgi:hypothetical protein
MQSGGAVKPRRFFVLGAARFGSYRLLVPVAAGMSAIATAMRCAATAAA